MPVFSRKNMKLMVTNYAPALLGIRIPGFIRIHLRYIASNPFVWGILFVAPFVIGLVTLSQFSRRVLQVEPGGWQLFFLVLFLIALAFYFAERNRTFRTIYVRAIPAMVILNGLIRLVMNGDFSLGGIIVFFVLSVIPAWLLWLLSTGMGYRMLSNGADRRYRPGRDFFMAGEYDVALDYLEPSARRGHMKSLYLIGEAFENGWGYDQDRVKAARLYNKSADKGYRKAQLAFERLCASFTAEEQARFENDVSISGINDLF